MPRVLAIGCILSAVVWLFAMSLRSVSDEEPPPVTPTTVERSWGETPNTVPASAGVDNTVTAP